MHIVRPGVRGHVAAPCPEDINGDGGVGASDLLSVLGDWGPCVADCRLSDLDFSGKVDIADLLVLLANWN